MTRCSKEGVPFYPKSSIRISFSGLLMMGILVCAAYFGPKGPEGYRTRLTSTRCRRRISSFSGSTPRWPYCRPTWRTVLLLTAPVVGIGLLFALPFISNTGEKSPRRRPIAVLGVIFVFLTLGSLTSSRDVCAVVAAHGSVERRSHSGAVRLKDASPLELQGALVLQVKQCRNCHSLGGEGGLRGPALDDVATRLTRDQLTRQVIQGGGNMPAYGKNLAPAEVSALVAFMQTLRPAHVPAARDSSVPAAPGG